MDRAEFRQRAIIALFPTAVARYTADKEWCANMVADANDLTLAVFGPETKETEPDTRLVAACRAIVVDWDDGLRTHVKDRLLVEVFNACLEFKPKTETTTAAGQPRTIDYERITKSLGGIDLTALRDRVRILTQLFHEDEPGLATWNAAVGNELRGIAGMLSPLICGGIDASKVFAVCGEILKWDEVFNDLEATGRYPILMDCIDRLRELMKERP